MFIVLGYFVCSYVDSFGCGDCFAIPCLRLKGDYLAVATDGLWPGLLAWNVLYNILPQFGGASGFTNIPHLSHFVADLAVLGIDNRNGIIKQFLPNGKVGEAILLLARG